ncbi:FIST signal transduction protein [Phaeodactylibacter xiamenensis]|uniref:FIST signal transduction protein n=1 Tax=Phaeodactylibacter xiamenensis TaxID=1524460 RepID=UPI003BA9A36F
MYVQSENPVEITEAILKMDIRPKDLIVLLVAESDNLNLQALIDRLNEAGVSFIGGIFPGVIHNSTLHKVGVVVKKLQSVSAPVIIQGLNTSDYRWPDFTPTLSGLEKKVTAWIMIDGLMPNIASFLSGLYDRLGDRVNFIGGGAGSLTLEQKPCLLTPNGLLQDAAVIALLDYDTHLGVKHGWKRLAGPIVATRTSHNIIYELNWEEAFTVYKNYVEKDCDCKMSPANFFEISKCYPFGISKSNAEEVVRDPISVNSDGGLVCVGEVPENTVLNIMKGIPENLIAAAAEAVEETLNQSAHNDYVRHTMVVDCVSRALFLEDRHEEELEQISRRIKAVRPEVSPQGMLSLGEISSYGEGYLEFFNKTIVIGSLY